MRVMRDSSFSWLTILSTMTSTDASIETVSGCSSGVGGSSVSNWLVSKPGGMKWPLRRPSRSRDQRLRAVEIDDADVVSAVHQDVAIGALERGAGDDDVSAVPR